MELNVKLLKAAAIAASKEETRYYLKGVAVQADARGAFVIATDGHRALAFCQSREPHEGATVNIIIPSDIVAAIKPNKYEERATLTQESATHWRLDYCGTSVIFAPVDGTFPDWRRICPKEASGETAQFNPEYVGGMAKAAKALGVKSASGAIRMAHNGEGPAIVTFGDDIDGFGLIMPTRANYGRDNYTTTPSWAH